ncbi:MAG TPA: BTAD domain-containing putative transcriptional regulator [Trebonia sp.]|nr:BTAD domain-containing putative transcriptional regulator [Trebonia sp.]
MNLDILGEVGVRGDAGAVSGHALGGRRARLVLGALALEGRHVPADRLAAMLWGDDLPPTWQAALRGVVRGLRAACAAAGGGGQQLIVTAPAGYRLADGVVVDVERAAQEARRAAALLAEGRLQAAADLADPVSRLSGDWLLPGEDGAWLGPHRRAVDATALRAALLVVQACSGLGDHHRAVETARRAATRHPLDESAHRSLITALGRSGDRAGAIAAYEQCRVSLAEQLGVDPSAETVDAYLAALGDQAAPRQAPVPAEANSFIGREPDLAGLARAIARPGLVTVTGKPGVGKSRLVMRAASGHPGFDGGRLWVALAPVAEDALVASSVALEIGVQLGIEDAAVAVADHLAPLGRVLLVLDGCERVADGVASLAATLLARAPRLTILATSQLPLHVEGEQVLTVAPFPLPDAAQGLLGNGQVRLLVSRVREAGGDLSVDEAIAPHLIALCRRCGGLPLALELVAAQLAMMPAGDLVDHLHAVLGEAGGLRSIARSSYLLLKDDEAAVFRRLAVLDGPVSLELARPVVSGDGISPARVVRILRELTACGLLSVDRSGPRWRYEQDDDLHRFAGELLIERREDAAAFSRLADAIAGRLPDDARASPVPFRAEITDMLGSVRSLFGAALTGHASPDRCQELAFRLHRYFATTNVDEGCFWLSRLLAERPSGQWAGYATFALGYLRYWSGDIAEAMRDLRSAVGMLDGAQDSYRARALIFLAGLLDDLDRGTEAVEHVRLSIEAAAPYEVDVQVSAAMGMGSVLAERGDPAAASYARDAIELCRRSGSAEQLALAMPTAAMVCWQVGALDQARAYIAEALPMHTGTRRIARVVLLSAAAGVALADGDVAAAVEFAGLADQEGSDLGIEREVPLVRAVLARALLAEGDVPGAARCSAAALTATAAMSLRFPFAIGLETAALVLHAAGLAAERELGALLATASLIRRAGDRPAPATLGGPVAELLAALGDEATAAALDLPEAVSGALALLARVVPGRQDLPSPLAP